MIRDQLNVPAHNALTDEAALAGVLIRRLFPELPGAGSRS
jgi:hypothetical protein